MEFWHQRYQQQAAWTRLIRTRAYDQTCLNRAQRILEVGCGTGVVTAELNAQTPAVVFGLDISRAALTFAHAHDPATRLIQGDGHSLPFGEGTFDAVIAHFLLLWVDRPQAVLRDMIRVLRPGGSLLCLAEPDYGGRIDHPPHLAPCGRKQARALRRSGADPEIGRKLPGLLAGIGLIDLHAGILGAEWQPGVPPPGLETECRVLALDMHRSTRGRAFDRLLEQEVAAWCSGERVLYVPTFYAYGRKPQPA